MLDVSSSQDYFVQYGRNYSIGEIVFHIKRNPEFYIFFVILPTFVVTATCISAMLLPLDMEIGERVSRAFGWYHSRRKTDFTEPERYIEKL